MDNGDRAALEWQLDEAQRLTHVGSWVWDRATSNVVWSDELYRIVGLPVGAPIQADSYAKTLHPEDRARVDEVVGAAMVSGQRFTIRVRVVRPDGAQREVEMIGEPTFDANRQLTGLIGTSRDITDELRREQTIRLFTDIVDGLAIGLSVWRIDEANELRLVASNPANQRLTDVSLAHAGSTLAACWPSAAKTDIPALLRGVTDEHPRGELGACRLGGQVYAVKAFALPDHTIGLSLEDVTQRVRDQRLHFAERVALEMLAASHPLEDILATIVQVTEELIPGVLASVMLLDSAQRLRTGAAPSMPVAWTDMIDGKEIGPASGSCGTAAYRRDAVFVSDIATDPLWKQYRDAARSFGLRACWSWPILANDGRVLGTFAMYFREQRSPDRTAVELCERVVHVAGLAIERRRLDERLQAALLSRAEGGQHGDVDNIRRRIE